MADGIGRFSSLLLQAVFAYVAAEGIATGAKRLSSSRLGNFQAEVLRSADAFEQAFGSCPTRTNEATPEWQFGTRSAE